jgi:thiamine-phosphate pyrophosphorylase
MSKAHPQRGGSGGRSAPRSMKPNERRAAVERSRLYLVAPGEFPVDVLQSVIEAGVDLVQLRMKDAEAAEVLEVGDAFMRVCHEAGVPFIVNDRPDIALALEADGVHLGQEDIPPRVAREILGPHAIIGRSTHSEADIARAGAEYEEGCADYIAVGPINETPTKDGRPGVGLGLIEHAAQSVSLPWFGIGGIDPSNVGDVVGAGAARIVVVRAIVEASDPVAAAAALRSALA